MVSYPYPKGRQAGEEIVLILIVMDNGLLRNTHRRAEVALRVLILIVMDNGLLLRLLRGRGRSQGQS